jgi:hypothetical protein
MTENIPLCTEFSGGNHINTKNPDADLKWMLEHRDFSCLLLKEMKKGR